MLSSERGRVQVNNGEYRLGTTEGEDQSIIKFIVKDMKP